MRLYKFHMQKPYQIFNEENIPFTIYKFVMDDFF